MKPQIGIIGFAGPEEYPKSTKLDPKCFEYAYQLGLEFGKLGWSVITGGKSGIMESANQGCQKGGGVSVGVISGNQRMQGNSYLDIEVISNSFSAGGADSLITMCDIFVMIGGGTGTLEELAIAYRMGKPVIIITGTGGWADRLQGDYLDDRKRSKLLRVSNAKQALLLTQKILSKKKGNKS